jgi:P-type Ca2+ transporter type 2C
VVVGSLNDWQKERQFQVLNEKKDERGVKVIRDGVEHVIDVKDVVVGDIALLEPGEVVPCDGVFISGHRVRCDESGATGESDAIKKVSYDEYHAMLHRVRAMRSESDHKDKDATGAIGTTEPMGLGIDDEAGMHTDCFILSGSKVLEGVGNYVVVAVGTKSFNGRIMMGSSDFSDRLFHFVI